MLHNNHAYHYAECNLTASRAIKFSCSAVGVIPAIKLFVEISMMGVKMISTMQILHSFNAYKQSQG